MPDIALVMCIDGEMEPLPPDAWNKGEFKAPALPSVPTLRKQMRTMEWLQMDVEDVHSFDCDTMSLYNDRIRHVSETVEVDFKELQKRSLSTSTPFVPRTSAMTSLHSDSGIDTFSLSLQSSSSLKTSSCCQSANDSLLTHSSEYHSHGASIESEPKILISSKCSETDSAFGDASVASHDLSQDSQISECFSLDLHPESFQDIEVRKDNQSHKLSAKDPQIQSYNLHLQKASHNHIVPVTQHISVLAHSSKSHSFVDSAQDLSLPVPSWCSPVPTPTTIAKPSCTSTPKDSIQENINELLKRFSPSEPDRLIGRKMGLDHVDIVSELHSRSICSLQLVFRHLQPKDLCRSCMVSSQWRSAVHSDPSALKRKKSFIRSQKLPWQKENSGQKGLRSKADRGMTSGTARLGAIQAVAKKTVLPMESAVMSNLLPPTPRHQLFWEEAKKCKEGESIRKCPRCTSPARVHNVQERAWCSSEKCGFDFCIRCSMLFHGARDCSILSPTKNTRKAKTENIIGSKKSKKKLRRL